MDEPAVYLHRLFYDANVKATLTGGLFLLAGGIAGFYVRFLFRRYARTVSNREGFSSIFPALTLAVVLVILVVKSSLALSLGLVGALSIVRFRAAIKEPEEIVYLFFCIALGLAFGAEFPVIAIMGMVAFTAFVLLSHRMRGAAASESLLLSISGTMGADGISSPESLTAIVREVVGGFKIQRLDVDEGELQFRAVVSLGGEQEVGASMARLRERLAGYRISYVNLENLL